MTIQSEIQAEASHSKSIRKSANSITESLVFTAHHYSGLLCIFRYVFFANFENYIMREWNVKLSLERSFGLEQIDGRRWNVSPKSDTSFTAFH